MKITAADRIININGLKKSYSLTPNCAPVVSIMIMLDPHSFSFTFTCSLEQMVGRRLRCRYLSSGKHSKHEIRHTCASVKVPTTLIFPRRKKTASCCFATRYRDTPTYTHEIHAHARVRLTLVDPGGTEVGKAALLPDMEGGGDSRTPLLPPTYCESGGSKSVGSGSKSNKSYRSS